MELVRAGLGDDVHLAGRAAELGRVDAGLHLELFERVDRRQQNIRVEVDVGVVRAVERVVVELAPLPGDRDLLVGARAALPVAGLPGARELGAHVRAERDERQEVAAVQRQLDDAPVLDDRADRRVFGRDQRRHARHFGRLRQRADFHREVDADRRLDLQRDLPRHRAEALKLGFDDVGPRRQRGKAIGTGLVALHFARRVRARALRRHRSRRE